MLYSEVRGLLAVAWMRKICEARTLLCDPGPGWGIEGTDILEKTLKLTENQDVFTSFFGLSISYLNGMKVSTSFKILSICSWHHVTMGFVYTEEIQL